MAKLRVSVVSHYFDRIDHHDEACRSFRPPRLRRRLRPRSEYVFVAVVECFLLGREVGGLFSRSDPGELGKQPVDRTGRSHAGACPPYSGL